MKDYIFDEKTMIENMIANNYVDVDSPCRTIKKLARYNYYVLGLSEKDSYDNIHKYMKKNYKEYTEIGYYKSIKGCIKDVTKSRWKNIKNVIITKRELEIIKSLNDDRYEKIAFVLLADAKYDNAYKEHKFDLSYLSTSDIYKLSRVTMPVKERALFLHFLYNNGLVDINLNPSSINKKLTYVSEDDKDVGIILNESNYKELAFTYMNWKYGGYKECKCCGKLFKAKKNTQYCKICSPKYEKVDFRVGKCVDCGVEFEVDARNTTKCRCDECQKEERKRQKRNWAHNN